MKLCQLIQLTDIISMAMIVYSSYFSRSSYHCKSNYLKSGWISVYLVPGVSTRYKVPGQKYQVLCQVQKYLYCTWYRSYRYCTWHSSGYFTQFLKKNIKKIYRHALKKVLLATALDFPYNSFSWNKLSELSRKRHFQLLIAKGHWNLPFQPRCCLSPFPV